MIFEKYTLHVYHMAYGKIEGVFDNEQQRYLTQKEINVLQKQFESHCEEFTKLIQ